MIDEMEVTHERIAYFQRLLAQLRVTARPEEFSAVTSGYRAEIHRMQKEILDYLTQHMSESFIENDSCIVVRLNRKLDMSTIEHVTLSELHNLLQSLQLPPDTHLTIKFEDAQAVQKAVERQKAIDAMKKLKGSGNGNLVAALLTEREKEALL